MPANGLIIKTSRLDANQFFVAELSALAQERVASESWQDGFVMMQFKIVANPEQPDSQMMVINAFNEWLGYDSIWQEDGETVWDGMICQMELVHGRVRRRRSLIDNARPVWNAVRAQYDNAGTLTNTAYATIDESIARYGRIEKTLTETAQSTSSIAQQYRDMILQLRGWPTPYTVSISPQPQATVLDIICCGYIVTADWQTASVSIGGTDNLSDVIDDLVTTDCPFLSIGRIDSNTLQVADEDLVGETPRQQIQHLVGLGDASDNMYRAYVGPDAKFYYVKVSDLTPKYYLTRDGIRFRLGSPVIQPHQVKPGIMRDATFPVVVSEPGSVFNSSQDMLITEVRWRQNANFPDLRTSELTDSDVYATKFD